MSLLDLYTLHRAPTQLVGYKIHKEHLPRYVWEKWISANADQYRNIDVFRNKKLKQQLEASLFPLLPRLFGDESTSGGVMNFLWSKGWLRRTRRDAVLEKIVAQYPHAILRYVSNMESSDRSPIKWPAAEKTMLQQADLHDQMQYYSETNNKLPVRIIQQATQNIHDFVYLEMHAPKLVTKSVWAAAIPTITQSPQTVTAYLQERSNILGDIERVPYLEPYILKMNNAKLASEYIYHTSFNNDIPVAILEIVERDPAVQRELLDTYLREAENENSVFVERAIVLLHDIPLAIDYVSYGHQRVKAFEPMLLADAEKTQSSKRIIQYIEEVIEEGYGDNIKWPAAVPVIVKYTSPRELLEFALFLPDNGEYTFFKAVQRAMAPKIVDALVNKTISMKTIVDYLEQVYEQDTDLNAWPELERLLKQYPAYYRYYQKAVSKFE